MRITDENFNQYFEKYRNTVYGVAYNFTRDTWDANDVTQDVYVKLYRSTDEFESDEHVKAWLIRVCANTSKSLLKKRANHKEVTLFEDLSYEVKDKSTGLLPMLMTLPENYRIPLHLFYYEDYSLKEIAKVLGCTEGTVKIRLLRGRKRLKTLLEKSGEMRQMYE